MAYDPEDEGVTPGVTEDPWAWTPGGETPETPEAPPSVTRPPPVARPLPGGYAPPATPVRTGLTRVGPPAVRAQPRASFADIDPSAQPLAVYGRPPPPEPDAGFWSNTGEIIKKTGYATAAEIMGAARYLEQQMSSDPEAKTWIERQRESLEEEASKEYSDPRLQRIMTASLMSAFGGSTDAKGNHIPSPGEVGWVNYFLYNTVAMVPTVALALLPATTTAKIATKLVSSLGAAAKTAKAVGAGAGIAESAGQFGLQNLGTLYNSVSGEVMKTPEKEMMKSPAYAELRRGGYSDEEAKAQLIKQTIPPMALQALMVGGLVGAGFTGMAARGAIAPLVSQGLKARIVGMGMGATEMGGLMGVQAGATTALGQEAQQGMGLRQGYDEEAIRANAVAAGISGLGMGAVFGAMHPPTPRAPRARSNPDLPDAERGALETALNPEGPPPPPSQGELFHPSAFGPTVRPGEPPIVPAPDRTEFPPSAAPLDTSDRTPGPYAPQPPSPAVNYTPPTRTPPRPGPPEPGSPVIEAPGAGHGFGMPGAEQPSLFTAGPPTAPPTNLPPVPSHLIPPPFVPMPPGSVAPPESTPAAPARAPKSAQRTSSTGGKAAEGPRPSAGIKLPDIRDALVTEFGMSQADVGKLSPADTRLRYDREMARRGSTPTPADTTLAPGVEPPTTGERSRPGEPVVAPPPGEAHSPQTAAGVGPTVTRATRNADGSVTVSTVETKGGARIASTTTLHGAEADKALASAGVEAPAPTRVTASQVQRRDGVGYNEAVKRAEAENKAAAGGPTGQDILEDAGIAVGDTVTAPLEYRSDGQPHKGAKPAIGEVVSVDGQHVTLKDASGKTWRARAEDLTKGEAVDPLAATEPGAAGRMTPEQKAESDARIAKMKADDAAAKAKREAEREAAAKRQSDLEAQTAATRDIRQAPEPEAERQDPELNWMTPEQKAAEALAEAKRAEGVTPGVKPEAPKEAVKTEVVGGKLTLGAAGKTAAETSKAKDMKLRRGTKTVIPEKSSGAYVEGAEGGTREDLAAKPEAEEQQPVREKTPEELRQERLAAEARAEVEEQAVANDANLERGSIGKDELHARDADDAHVTAPNSRVEEAEGLGSEQEIDAAAPTRTVRAPGEGDLVGGEHVAGEETSGTMRSQLGETREETVAKGTGLVDRAKALVRRMLDGDIGPEVADHIYGQQKEGKGRARTTGYRNLAEVITNLIKRAEDKDAEQKLLTQFRKDIEGTPQKRSALTKQLEKDLAEFGDERAQQLRDILERLTDPPKTAADQAQAMAERAALKGKMAKRTKPPEDSPGTPMSDRPTPDGIDPRSSRYVISSSQDARVDAGYVHALNVSEEHGVAFTTHDFLRRVVQDPLVRSMLAPFRMLATQLLKRAPDIPMMSMEHARDIGIISDARYQDYKNRNVYGLFDPDAGHILVNANAERVGGTHVETGLHEIMHAITFNYIRSLEASNKLHPDLMALHAIRRELARHIDEEYAAGRLSKLEQARLSNAMSTVHELHTQLMTDPVVQGFVASRVASPELRSALASYGFAPREQGRSVWRYFTDWMRKAMGLKAPATAWYTMLDHLLRPMTEITERGAAFEAERGKRLLPKDPVLRASAEPLYDAAGQAFSERTGRLAERALNAVRDRLSPSKAHALLQSIHLDRMVDSFGHIMQDGDVNHIKEIRKVQERAEVAGQDFLKKFGPEAGEITRELTKHDDVAELMNDAGYGRAALGTRDVEANKHLTTPEERAQLAALQTRFDTMPAEKQALYNKTRDFLDKKYAFEREAVATGFVNRFIPDATQTEKTLLSGILKSKTKLDEFLKDPDNVAIADERKRIAKGIAKLTRMGFVDGDYFPMRRYGDFAVEYGGAHGTPEYGVQFFERPSEAAAFRTQQIADGVPHVSGVRERHEIVAQSKGRLSPVVEDMLDAVRKDPALRPHADKLEDMAAHLQLRYASGWEKATAKRRYVAGASKDVARAINTDVAASSRRIGTIIHGGERDAAFQRMKAFVDEKGRDASNPDNTLRDQIYHELQLRFQRGDELDQTGAFGIARRFAQFGVAQNLLSLSRAPVETYEMTSKMLTFIGATHGYARGALELGRALKAIGPQLVGKGAKNTLDALIGKPLSSVNYKFTEIAKQRFMDKGYDRSEVNALFKHFEANGLWGNTQAGFLRELSRPATLGGLKDRFLEFSSALTQATDEMGRIAGTMAAFKTARSKGLDVHDAINFAEDTLRKAPNYSATNRARLTTTKGSLGGAAPMIMQFKMYGLNESWLIANMVRNSFGPGVDKAVRIEAAKQLAGTVMMHSLAAGALTWLADPVRYLGGAYDLATGHKRKDRMLEMRAWLAKNMGPTMGEVVGAGVPHLFGMDMQHRLGVNNMFNVPQLNGTSPKDFLALAGEFALGSPGSAAANVVSGFAKMLTGGLSGGLHDMTDAAKILLPRVLHDPVKAYDLASRGVVDSRGKETLSPAKISPLDVAYQGLGFAPSRVTEAREGRQAIVQARDYLNETRTKLVQRWLGADPVDRAAIWSEIAHFNASPRVNLGAKITRDQLLQQLQQRKQGQQHPGAFGLRLPKASERQLMEYGAFANH